MSPETIKFIIYLLIIAAIIFFIVKKVIIIAIIIIFFTALFNIVFVMDGSEVIEKYKVNEYFDDDTGDKITNFLNDFSDKKDEFGVVNTDKVKEDIDTTIQKGISIFVEGVGKVDINKFAKELSEKIYEVGNENIDFEALTLEIKEQLNITYEEAKLIVDKVQENQ